MSRKLNSLIMFKVQNCSIQHCSFTKRLQIRKLLVQPNFAPWWYGRSKTCFSGAFQSPGQLRQTSKELSGDFTALRTWDTTVGHRRTAKKACCVPACGFGVLNARETLLCKKNWWRKNPKTKLVRIPPPTATHRVRFWRVGALPATLCGGGPQAGLPTGFRKVLAEAPQGRSCLGARSASKPFPGLTDSLLCNRQSRCLMNRGSDLCFQMQGCFSWDISISGK